MDQVYSKVLTKYLGIECNNCPTADTFWIDLFHKYNNLKCIDQLSVTLSV
jgi:hypothetical protein